MWRGAHLHIAVGVLALLAAWAAAVALELAAGPRLVEQLRLEELALGRRVRPLLEVTRAREARPVVGTLAPLPLLPLVPIGLIRQQRPQLGLEGWEIGRWRELRPAAWVTQQ